MKSSKKRKCELDGKSGVYDSFFREEPCFFGKRPSPLAKRLIKHLPARKSLHILDIGCGEGRNAVFFAKHGHKVTAFDTSQTGIAKTRDWAGRLNLEIDAFTGNLRDFKTTKRFDVIFSSWVLQFVPPGERLRVMRRLRRMTKPNGLNGLSVFVRKPYLKSPHHERHCTPWKSGELFLHYWDWQLEWLHEEVFCCECGGKPHKHAANHLIAKNGSGKRK